MSGKKLDAVFAIYRTHKDVESAFDRLRNWGFSMSRISLAGRGHFDQEKLVGCYVAGGRMRHLGEVGVFWDDYWGLLSGAGFFYVPELGPILVAGPLVSWMAAALLQPRSEHGLSGVTAGLAGLGISEERADEYDRALRASQFLFMVHGAVEEVNNARELLHGTEYQQLHVYTNAITPPAGASHFFG